MASSDTSSSDTTASTSVTPDAYAAMRAQLVRLENVELPRLIAAIEDARSDSISPLDNAAMDTTRGELEALNGRIRSLRARLADAVVVGKVDADGTVRVGSVVTLDLAGERFRVEVGGDGDGDVEGVSPASPLGEALLAGVATGSTVRWRAPAAELEATVVDVT
jgi:transcription elongation factor GreA